MVEEVKRNLDEQERTSPANETPETGTPQGLDPEPGTAADESEPTADPGMMTEEQLLVQITHLEQKAAQNFDLYLRSQAEMENLKKRFQREKTDLVKYANEELIKQLLPVMDNLQQALAHARVDDAVGPLREGVELTLKGLRDTLEKAGLKEINALGELFDPNYHEAISTQTDQSVAPETVLQEFQKGYLLNHRLIRPAMVIVNKGK